MRSAAFFFGLLLGVLLGGCRMISEPAVIPQGTRDPNVRMETRIHRYYYASSWERRWRWRPARTPTRRMIAWRSSS